MPEIFEDKSSEVNTESQGAASNSLERPAMFIINRFDNILIDVNTWFEKKFGIKKEQVLGKTILECGLLPDKENVDLLISLQHPHPYGGSSNITFLAHDGRKIPLHMTANPVRIGTAECIIYISSTHVDLMDMEKAIEIKNDELEATNEELLAAVDELETTNEELTQAYHDLQESESRYRDFFESSTDGIILSDINGYIVECNMAFAEITGYKTNTEMKGLSFRDLTPAEYREEEKKIIEECQTGGGWTRPYEKEYLRKDGTRIPVSIQGWTNRDYRGNISGMWAIVRDISDRKQLEKTFHEITELLETVIKELPVIVIVIDYETGRIIHVNDSFERATGFTRKQAIGNTPTELNLFNNPDDRQRIIDLSLNPSRDIPVEASFRTCNGSVIYGLVSSNQILIGQNKCILTAIQDISYMRAIEKEKDKIQSQLIHMQKMEAVGTLAGGLAHDFNNILGGIVGSLELLKRIISREQIKQGETIQAYISTALSSCARATDLTRQLLSLTRKNELQTMPVDLTQSMKHVMKLCMGSFPKSIDIHFEIPDKPVRVMGDPAGIEQILLNLCVNASQAMTIMRDEMELQGGILKVSLKLFEMTQGLEKMHPKADSGITYACIAVEDTGVGMSPDIIPRIYEPFFTTHVREKGTGLGLTIVYNTLQQHRGFINVSSIPGKGSVFTMYIPALPDLSGEMQIANPGETPVIRKGTILAIDDEKDLLAITREMLTMLGFDSLVASTSEEGLNIIREHDQEIKAVILDMSMPGKSGYDVFLEIHSISPRIKVLLTSGFSYLEQAEKAVKEGAKGFLQKPYSMTSLAAKLDEILK